MFIALGVLFAFSVAIGVLIIVLSPREASVASAARCVENLGHLRTALTAYATDHDDRLPPSATTISSAQLQAGVVAHWQDAERRWPPADWQRAVYPYLTSPQDFLCPETRSALSYQLNTGPQGLDQALVGDKLNYALLWDVGLRERPGEGPHGGKYAVITLGGTGLATDGREELFGRLLFRP